MGDGCAACRTNVDARGLRGSLDRRRPTSATRGAARARGVRRTARGTGGSGCPARPCSASQETNREGVGGWAIQVPVRARVVPLDADHERIGPLRAGGYMSRRPRDIVSHTCRVSPVCAMRLREWLPVVHFDVFGLAREQRRGNIAQQVTCVIDVEPARHVSRQRLVMSRLISAPISYSSGACEPP